MNYNHDFFCQIFCPERNTDIHGSDTCSLDDNKKIENQRGIDIYATDPHVTKPNWDLTIMQVKGSEKMIKLLFFP